MNDIESKTELQSTIKILNILIDKGNISNGSASQIAGGYLFLIKRNIKENCHANIHNDGISCIFHEQLIAYKEVCLDKINEISRIEHERELDERYKLVHIKHVNRAYILSIIALVISLAAATISLCQLQGWKLL